MKIESFACYSVALILALSLWASCSGKKPKAEPTRQEIFLSELTAADTTEVLTRAQSVIDKIIAGDVNGALDGLGQVENDTLFQISSEKIVSASNQFKKMNLRQAKLESYTFTDQITMSSSSVSPSAIPRMSPSSFPPPSPSMPSKSKATGTSL